MRQNIYRKEEEMKKKNFFYKKSLFIFLALVFSFFLSAQEKKEEKKSSSLQQRQQKVYWRKHFRNARKNAKDTQKLLLVFFSVSDLPGMKNKQYIQRYHYNRNFLTKAGEDYVLLHVDLPRNKETLSFAHYRQNERLRSRFGVTHYPTFILLDPASPWGNMVYKYTGGISPENLLSDMEKKAAGHLKKYRRKREERVKKDEKQ